MSAEKGQLPDALLERLKVHEHWTQEAIDKAIADGYADISRFPKIDESNAEFIKRFLSRVDEKTVRSLEGVAKRLNELITEPKEREIWVNGLVLILADDFYRAPEFRSKSWRNLCELCSKVFHKDYPIGDKSFAIVNGKCSFFAIWKHAQKIS